MTERVVKIGDVELQTQAFGDPANPPVLLIMGVMASMLWWPERFCEELAQSGRYVIRYDNRDTGLSTNWPQGQPGYSFSDMADDAIRILDAYGLPSAHVVGMSMGGMLAQEVALRHKDHVRTLTLISTSPVGIKNLPPMTAAYGAHSETGEAVDWSDNASIADFIKRDCAMLAGTNHPHDAEAASALIERDIARARNFPSVTNHFMLVGSDDGPQLYAANISSPLLVIHGSADPIFPIEHGEAFVAAIPGARLHRIEGGGHELHEAEFASIAQAIVEHTA